MTCYNMGMELGLRFLILFGIVVLATGIVRGRSSVTRSYHLERNADILRHQIAQLVAENKALDAEITKIKKSSSYARKVLRDKYHLLDNGENIMFFAD